MCVCIQVNTGSLYFIFGGVSKLIATVVTYPLQVLQTRARVCFSYSFTRNFWFWLDVLNESVAVCTKQVHSLSASLFICSVQFALVKCVSVYIKLIL